MYGPVLTQPGQLLGAYTETALPAGALANATHLVWATGEIWFPGKKCSATTQKARRWHRVTVCHVSIAGRILTFS